MRRNFNNFLLLLASTLMALLLGELFLWLFFPVNPPRFIGETGQDSWSVRDAAGEVTGLIPNLRGRFISSEFNVSIQLNNAGFRDQTFTENKTLSATRICILGDSFTFGYGVEAEETYGAQLEKKLRGRGYEIEVDNLGVPATATGFQYGLFQNLPSPQPDIVILGLLATYADKTGNDLIGNLEFAESRAQALAAGNGESSAAQTQETSSFSKTFFYQVRSARRWLLQHSHLQRRLELLIGQQFPRWLGNWQAEATRNRIEKGWALTQEWLLKFQALTKLQNCALVLLRIPFSNFLTEEEARMDRLMKEFTARHDFLLVDGLQPALKKSQLPPRELYFAIDGHWRPIAHQLCAEVLADFLVTKNLLRSPLHE